MTAAIVGSQCPLSAHPCRSRSLPRVSANRADRPFSLGGGNGSKCPIADLLPGSVDPSGRRVSGFDRKLGLSPWGYACWSVVFVRSKIDRLSQKVGCVQQTGPAADSIELCNAHSSVGSQILLSPRLEKAYS